MATIPQTLLKVTSPSFRNNELIPKKYCCDGDDINPALIIGDLPEKTESLALIMDDPDAPNGTYDHWVMWNITPSNKIEENSVPGVEGKNSSQEYKYKGPCPPRGTHHYHFNIYALDTKLELKTSSTKQDLLNAMENHILAKGEIVGLYKR